MAEGFGQYVGTGTARTRELQRRVEEIGTTDPEDIMMFIMEIFKEEVLYPEPGKFYTFYINQRLQTLNMINIPLIACTSLERWGFKGINFHWREGRQYTWEEVIGKLHVVKYNELMNCSFQYGKFRLNK
jgi:hypothetical protein